jgi:hypothetical protein
MLLYIHHRSAASLKRYKCASSSRRCSRPQNGARCLPESWPALRNVSKNLTLCRLMTGGSTCHPVPQTGFGASFAATLSSDPTEAARHERLRLRVAGNARSVHWPLSYSGSTSTGSRGDSGATPFCNFGDDASPVITATPIAMIVAPLMGHLIFPVHFAVTLPGKQQ